MLLLVLGVVTDWTIRLIVLNAKMSGRRSYIDIMDSCEFDRALDYLIALLTVARIRCLQVSEEKVEQLVHSFNSHSHSVYVSLLFLSLSSLSLITLDWI